MTQTVVTILIVVSVVASLIAAGVVTYAVSHMMRRNREYKVRVELSNLGNVPTRYELKAYESTGLVNFQFAANGAPLVARQIAGAVMPAAAPAIPQPARPEPQRAPAPGGQAMKQAAGAGNAVAELLMTVGYLLPGGLGSPLIQLASQMRYGQYAAQRVSNLPRQIKNMAPGTGGDNSTYVGGSNYMPPSSTPAAGAVSVGAAAATPIDAWTPTPIVQPGQSLMLDLQVIPANPGHAQHCSFTVQSRATEDSGSMPIAADGDIQITGVSTLQRVLPWLVFAGISILGITCSLFLILSNRG
jgi:hypothetical protein